MLKLVILESPFAATTEEIRNRNISYARSCIKDCLDRDESPLAGHMLYTQPDILDDTIQEEREKGIQAHLAWVPVAQAVVVYEDYGRSHGMTRTIEAADAAGVPVEFRRILHLDLAQN